MASPFPGMDPWLEDPAIFPDLHDSFIVEMRKAIMVRLPAPYYAAIKNRIWVDLSLRHIEPDVDVLYPSSAPPKGTVLTKKKRSGKNSAMEPLVIHVPGLIQSEDMEEWFLEIFAKPGDEQLVTTIELLSLSNKREGNKGRELYQKKQKEILNSKVNLVEIDFLRGGLHTSVVPRSLVETRAGDFDYHISVHPMDCQNECHVYAWKMEARLPAIKIPLLPGDPEVVVDLQPILDECYDGGGYGRRVRYRKWKPQPRLTKEKKEWADKILRAKGL